MQRDLDRKDKQVTSLSRKQQALRGRLAERMLREDLGGLISEEIEERGERLRSGSITHIVRMISPRFDVVDDEDNEGELILISREYEDPAEDIIGDIIDELIDDEEFRVFLDDGSDDEEEDEEESRPAKVRGTHRTAKRDDGSKKKKPVSLKEAFKERRKQAKEKEGFRPSIGLKPPAETRNGRKVKTG